MPAGSGAFLARTIGSIDDVDAACWDALANPPGAPCNPFVSHAFLCALERSKSVAPETGWAPVHILLEHDGALIGAAPLYAKGHSQGEFVFDHHWADAYARAGGRYYPKVLGAAPFTPVPGPRLLGADGAARAGLAAAIISIAERMSASSAHVNFIGEEDARALSGAGFLPRMGEQYHWYNRGYDTFTDFLAALSSRKRKAVKRERREAVGDDLVIRRLIGEEITERDWSAFWMFYQDTGVRKWGQPYLTRDFFRLIADAMSERLVFFLAESEGRPVAGALNFIGGDALFGRYWGCLEDRPFLHFELCYYQAIEFAIERRLARVEAGAQGQHKIARGYEPVATHSAHWIADAGFRDAIARYLDAEREQTGIEIDALKDFTPFKKIG